jgi:hypothetical protein
MSKRFFAVQPSQSMQSAGSMPLQQRLKTPGGTCALCAHNPETEALRAGAHLQAVLAAANAPPRHGRKAAVRDSVCERGVRLEHARERARSRRCEAVGRLAAGQHLYMRMVWLLTQAAGTLGGNVTDESGGRR